MSMTHDSAHRIVAFEQPHQVAAQEGVRARDRDRSPALPASAQARPAIGSFAEWVHRLG